MEKAKTQNGLIGFFDILGYQSLLENNDVEIAVFEVLDTINNIGSIVNSGLLSEFPPYERDKKIVDNIRWLVFSDTILMALEWNEPNLYECVLFNLAAIRLCRHMFNFGLPLRGAITNGKYVISKSCFAGRVMVDAYQSEKTLNLAGCSIDHRLVDMITEVEAKNGTHFFERIAVPYMTPLKDDQCKETSLLNYLLLDGVFPKPNAADIPQLILNSFSAHRKDINADVEIKARNTESFLRFLVHRFPEAFANTSV